MSSKMPSSEWNQTERMNFAASLAEQLQTKAARGIISREGVYDVSERIRFVLSASASFLEINRTYIIEGQNQTGQRENKF